MPDTKLRKQRTAEDMMSINAGQCFSPPTAMYDAACLAEDAHARGNQFGYGSDERWKHRERLTRLTIDQGSSTLSRDAGDFDYFGGTPDELMAGK